MPKHASTKRVRVVDTLAAGLTLVIGRKSRRGRHALPSTVTSGADAGWGLVLRHLNKEPSVRPEVRA